MGKSPCDIQYQSECGKDFLLGEERSSQVPTIPSPEGGPAPDGAQERGPGPRDLVGNWVE